MACRAAQVFRHFDEATTGKVVDDKLTDLVAKVQREIVPTRTERAIRQGTACCLCRLCYACRLCLVYALLCLLRGAYLTAINLA